MKAQFNLLAAGVLCISALAVASEADINEAIANAKAQYQANELLPAAAQLDYRNSDTPLDNVLPSTR